MNRKIVEILKRFGRMIKLQYIKLLRSPGGARKVATGFAIGFGMEMLVISTAMVIYVLLIPFVRIARGSLPASIIGNLICKVTFLPVLLLPAAMKLGKLLTPNRPEYIPRSVFYYLHTLLGMSIFAFLLGFLSFFPVYYLYEARRKHREKIRLMNRAVRVKSDKGSVTLHNVGNDTELQDGNSSLENASSLENTDHNDDNSELKGKDVPEQHERISETSVNSDLQVGERDQNLRL
jgi:uncharacterized protein (DUF2062 family)